MTQAEKCLDAVQETARRCWNRPTGLFLGDLRMEAIRHRPTSLEGFEEMIDWSPIMHAIFADGSALENAGAGYIVSEIAHV